MKPFQPKPPIGNPPYVVAHRGISSKAPENTAAAFSLALQTPGIDMIELDVRLSRDDEVIVLHDRTLQRTTTGNGPARTYDFAEIKTFDAGSWFDPRFTDERVPTLRKILQLVRGRCWVNIELKSDFLFRPPSRLLEQQVLRVVEECGMQDSVFYSSFDHSLVSNIKSMNPRTTVGVLYNLYRDFGRMPSKLARRCDASIFVCARHELTRAMLRDAHTHGLAVYVYTLNSLESARKMVQLGVDGILSDVADEIVRVVKQGA